MVDSGKQARKALFLREVDYMTQPILNDEQKLWNRWINERDPDAGDLLIKKYISLVSYHVQRIGASLPKSVSRDDLMSLGMVGLFDALNKFDINRDLKFLYNQLQIVKKI